MTETREKDLTYTSERWPTWVILVSIFLFHIGLLSLLAGKQKFLLHVSLIPEGSRSTRVIFTGAVSNPGTANQISALPG